MKQLVSRHVPATRLAWMAAIVVLTIVAGSSATSGEKKSSAWTQWGGTNHAFKAESSGLAESWPEEGPPRLWSRELGEGYSAILYDQGRLYTMHKAEAQEAVIALDAKTGETVWEFKYDSGPAEGHVTQFGEGPRATPLISGGRIYTIGVAGMMHCLNLKDGKLLWSHDLWGEDFGGSFLNHGYSSSPIEYKNTVIALAGGEGASIIAFDKKSGKVVWKNQSFKNSYSTPKIFNIGGHDELITFMATELVSVNPTNGELNWSFPHENQWGQNVNMPVLAGGDHLFLSSPQAGAKGLKITRKGDKSEIEEVWSTRKIQFYHVTSVQDGDWVYGSTGTMGPAFMAAVNIKTGEIAWRKRGFAKANVIEADGKLIILDEDGNLALTSATPEDLVVHSKVEMLGKVAWTVPTIVGKVAFLRDKTTLMAVNLG